MKTKPSLPRPRLATAFLAATLAGIIAMGILASVMALFQRDGKPLEQLVIAQRACTGHGYVSERDACVREWLAAPRAPYKVSVIGVIDKLSVNVMQGGIIAGHFARQIQ